MLPAHTLGSQQRHLNSFPRPDYSNIVHLYLVGHSVDD